MLQLSALHVNIKISALIKSVFKNNHEGALSLNTLKWPFISLIVLY